MRRIFVLFLLLLASNLSFGDESQIDSLKKIIAIQQAQIQKLTAQATSEWSKLSDFSLGTKNFAIGNGKAYQRYRIVGDTLEVVFYVAGKQTNWGSGPVRLVLPDNFIVDKSKLLPTLWGDRFPCGSGHIYRHMNNQRELLTLTWLEDFGGGIFVTATVTQTSGPTTIEELNLSPNSSQIAGRYCVPIIRKR